MDKYKDAACPVCGKPFTESDDIVVCPECGAPHHRACWQQLGHCGCTELHETGAQWRAPANPSEPSEPDPAPEAAPKPQTQICPACHAENNPDAAFCSACGRPLKPMAQPFVLAMDPLGGVAPDEEIDGVPAKQLAEWVGPNSAYYIPRFREISQGKRKAAPNLAAFLFDIPWFFYRKMILPGLGMLILELALAVPTMWMLVQLALHGDGASFSRSMYSIANVCTIAQWGVRIAVSWFANKIYLRTCTAKIRRLRESHDATDLPDALRKKGGVVPAVLWIWIALTVVYSIVQLMLLY